MIQGVPKVIETKSLGKVAKIKPDLDCVDDEPTVVGYTLKGKNCESDSAICVAKSSFDKVTGVTKYWIKRATQGSYSGRLFNTEFIMAPQENPQRFWYEAARHFYEFKKASQESFEFYLQFLRTENTIFLRKAERC